MLGEDNSDPIKVHPELNSVSSPRQCSRARVRNFGKFSVVSTRMRLLTTMVAATTTTATTTNTTTITTTTKYSANMK